MKTSLHKADERGIAEHGWLHSRFSFSFANYHNRERMGFGVLRVINDDIIEPSGGFGTHPHHDMEIVTILIKGSLEHKDSEGNHGTITAGHIQYMSAGSGVEHSEFNPSSTEQTQLFQIWIFPQAKGLPPRYEQRDFRDLVTKNRWAIMVSSDGRDGSMPIRQDASIMMAHVKAGHTLISNPIKAGHGRLLLVIEGEINTCGHTLQRRDELQVISNEVFEITANSDAHLLMIDVPME
ncbi:MAG: pirin family protein [Sulfuricurvum sp.]|nr:pirin family protein [Sulfuricurvum sp.]